MIQVRQTPSGICLVSFTVIDLFRYVYPVVTHRMSVALDFRFPATLAVRLDVLLQCEGFLFLLHICSVFERQRKGKAFYPHLQTNAMAVSRIVVFIASLTP